MSATSYSISMYGIPDPTPEEIEQRKYDKEHGIVRYHPTTYLEYSIPSELEDELSEFIERRTAQFEKKCQCEDCKNNRKQKK